LALILLVALRLDISSLIPHKDWQLALDSILRFVASHQDAGLLVPFAVVLSNEGKIAQLDGGCSESQRGSVQTRIRVIEAGLLLMAQQGKCKAIGVWLGSSTGQNNKSEVQVVLEHQDGTAYRILLPWIDDGAHGDGIVLGCAPEFFVNRVSERLASVW
jgi:hypothetical protein